MRTYAATVAVLALAGFGSGDSAVAASTSCRHLPVSALLQTDDPTELLDLPQAVAHSVRAKKVSSLRVTLRRGTLVYARGTLSGRLGGRSTVVGLTMLRTPAKGLYRLTATGRVAGCSSRSSISRDLRLRGPTLPLRAAPVSTLVGDNSGAVRLALRAVARRGVQDVRATLLDAGGATVAEAGQAERFTAQVLLALPLAQPLAPGRYVLRLSALAAGASTRQQLRQALVFAPGGGGAAEVTPTGVAEQQAVVDWSGGKDEGRNAAGFTAPGAGFGEVVCRPDAQYVRVFPQDPRREVAMMTWTYKNWSEGQEKALREALHAPGTGPDFLEGINKFSPPEKRSTGSFDAIVSDRGPFGNLGAATLAPPTTMRMTWEWDFSDPATAHCHVQARFSTETSADSRPLARSAQVLWRGDEHAPGRDVVSVDVPGLGGLTLSCQAGVDGVRRVLIDTGQGAAITTREGSDDATTTKDRGPIEAQLPNNGMLEVRFDGGATLLISSRWKVNDPDPAQNGCQIAAQAIVA